MMIRSLSVALALALLPSVAGAQTSGFQTPSTAVVPPPTIPTRLPVNTPAVDAIKSLAALNDSVAVASNGLNTAIVRLAPGAWTGTFVVEGTADGVTYDVPLNVLPYGGGAAQSSITAPGTYEITITGLAGVQVRASSAIVSGPVAALVRAAFGNKSIRVGAPSSNPVPVSAASLPLPAGAATSANQPALSGDGGSNAHVTNFPTTQVVTQPDARATGTIAAGTLNASYAVALNNAEGVVGFTISGLTGSGATLVPEASNDGGTTWSTINAISPGSAAISQALTVNQQMRVNAGGHTHVRLRVSIAGSGTINVASSASSNQPIIADPQNAAFQGAVAMTVGQTYAAQRSLAANCTAAGNVSLTFADASTLTVAVVAGYQTFPFAVTAVGSATATCTYANLR